MMLGSKAAWVTVECHPGDREFDQYPDGPWPNGASASAPASMTSTEYP